jgi:hypothetical protein
VAACDLDADHRVMPDWSALGEVPCRACGAPVAGGATGFSHVDPARDAEHEADPGLPGALAPAASGRAGAAQATIQVRAASNSPAGKVFTSPGISQPKADTERRMSVESVTTAMRS